MLLNTDEYILTWSIPPLKYKSLLYFLYPIAKSVNVLSVIVTGFVDNGVPSLYVITLPFPAVTTI